MKPDYPIYNLALIGFGNVGKAFVRLLAAKRDILRDRYAIDFRVTGIASRRIGWMAEIGGFDLDALAQGKLPPEPRPRFSNVRDWLNAAAAHVLFETSSLNRNTGEPAAEHIRAALQKGAHAISANKGPVVFHLDELTTLAATHSRRFLYEASVMDGTPIFNMFRNCLPAIEVRGFRGVLNSTTNVILGGMERGLTFEDSLREAQRIGVAESDPTDDIEGWDAAVKTVALANVLMGGRLTPAAIERCGIGELTGDQVRAARQSGKAYKLVCRAVRHDGGIDASVRLEALSLNDPLALVEGTSSIVYFETDIFPGLALTEAHAGLDATAYGLLVDFVEVLKDDALAHKLN
jgi:homoserine dehydrogenase